jgi:hypothetical protein
VIHWFHQLSAEKKKSWPVLKVEFKMKYCKAYDSYLKQYYDLLQRPSEIGIEYLYRFNSIALKAGIDYYDRPQPHIIQFKLSLVDPVLKAKISVLQIDHIDTLEKILQDHLKMTEGEKRFQRRLGSRSSIPAPTNIPASTISTSRYGRPPPRDDRPKPTPSVHATSFSEGEDSDVEYTISGEDLLAEAHDYESVQMSLYAFQRQDSKLTVCSKCKNTHPGDECWKCLQCSICSRMGHPDRVCRSACHKCPSPHLLTVPCAETDAHLALLKWVQSQPAEYAANMPPAVQAYLKARSR